MKLNLNVQLKNIHGQEGVGERNNAGKILAHALWNSSTGGLKFSSWALSLFKGDAISIDQTDKDILLSWLETCHNDPNISQMGFNAGAKGQLEQLIRDQWDSYNKPTS